MRSCSRSPLFPILLAFSLTVISCARAAGDRTGAAAPTRRDSAGIEIVENPLAEPRRASGWTVSPTAYVSIGASDGAVEYLLNRVKGAVRFTDGRILLGHDRTELRIYSATGQHESTKSIRGLGPEELQTLYAVLPYRGDSVLLRGGGPGTGMEAMIIDSRGQFGRKFQIGNVDSHDRRDGVRTLSGAETGLQGAAGDGSLIIRGSTRVQLRGENGPLWGVAPHFRVDATGKLVDTLATLRTTDLEEGKDGSGTGALNYGIPLFDRGAPVAAISGNSMFHGDADRFEILVFDLSNADGDAQPARIIRYALPNRAVGADERTQHIETLLEAAQDAADSTESRKFYEDMAVRSSFPAYTRLVTDADGNLWAEHPRIRAMSGRPDSPTEWHVWTVFDATGALSGDVTTPPGLKIMQIGRDFLLGLWIDEDGVEHVRVHRLERK